jgi:hypothetical protein
VGVGLAALPRGLAHIDPLLKFPAGRRATARLAAGQVRRRHLIPVIRATLPCRPGGSSLGAGHTNRTGRSPRPCAEIHRISTAVPPPLHKVLEGKQVSPLRCRLIVQVAEGAEADGRLGRAGATGPGCSRQARHQLLALLPARSWPAGPGLAATAPLRCRAAPR